MATERKTTVEKESGSKTPQGSDKTVQVSYKDSDISHKKVQETVERHVANLLALDKDGSLKNPDMHRLHQAAWTLAFATVSPGADKASVSVLFDQKFEKIMTDAIRSVFGLAVDTRRILSFATDSGTLHCPKLGCHVKKTDKGWQIVQVYRSRPTDPESLDHFVLTEDMVITSINRKSVSTLFPDLTDLSGKAFVSGFQPEDGTDFPFNWEVELF